MGFKFWVNIHNLILYIKQKYNTNFFVTFLKRIIGK